MAISSNNNNTDKINYYPSNILSPENKYRSIKIIVKNISTFSVDVDSIKEAISEAYGDAKQAFDSLTNKGEPVGAKTQKNLNSRSPKIKNLSTVYGIALPLPNELSDSQSHQWQTTEGLVSTVAGGLTNASVAGVSINKAVGQLANKAGFRKPLIDPGYFQDYKGTEPREFTFSWDLIPNNAEEVDQIMSILYHLKKYTLPTSMAGVSLLSPFIFDIKIGNDRINNIINMNNVVCKSMNINFAAEGSLQFLPDGMPKYIRLEMSFAERTLVSSEFY